MENEEILKDRSEGLRPKIPVPREKVYCLLESCPEFRNIVPELLPPTERIALAGIHTETFTRAHQDRCVRVDNESLKRQLFRDSVGRLNPGKERQWKYSTGPGVTQTRVRELVAKGRMLQEGDVALRKTEETRSANKMLAYALMVLAAGFLLTKLRAGQ